MCRVHRAKFLTGWITRWNQDCQNINNLKYVNDTTLMAESEEELNEPLDEGERGVWKAILKLNI